MADYLDRGKELKPTQGNVREAVQEWISQNKALEDIRQPYIKTCREITDWILPYNGFYLSEGETADQIFGRGDDILKAEATLALQRLGAGMQAGMASPAMKWFAYTLKDKDLAQWGPVKDWLGQVEQIVYETLAGSNFYAANYESYIELGGFGTSVRMLHEHYDKVIWFTTLTAGEYCVVTDEYGQPNGLFRRFPMTADQMARQFGPDALSRRVKEALDKRPHKAEFEVLHIIYPNDSYRPQEPGKAGMTYREAYVEYTGEKESVLAQSGYYERPFVANRWHRVASSSYGMGPCHTILTNVIGANDYEDSSLEATHKMVNPPIQVPAGWEGMLDLTPGAVNPVDQPGAEGIRSVFDMRFDLGAVQALKEGEYEFIRQALYTDLFLMFETRPGITATEILERREEKLFQLGPTTNRLESDDFDPTHARIISILSRRNMLPPPPKEILTKTQAGLDAVNLSVEYVGRLSQAQKAVGSQKMDQVVGRALEMANIKPEVLDNVDLDEYLRKKDEMEGIPAGVIRGKDEVIEIRKQRAEKQAQQQEQAQALELAGQAADAAAKLGTVKTEEPNLATDLLRDITGPESGAI